MTATARLIARCCIACKINDINGAAGVRAAPALRGWQDDGRVNRAAVSANVHAAARQHLAPARAAAAAYAALCCCVASTRWRDKAWHLEQASGGDMAKNGTSRYHAQVLVRVSVW